MGTLHLSEYAMQVCEEAQILCLTETGSQPPIIPGFTLVEHAVRDRAGHCGGVACLVRSDAVAALRPQLAASYPSLGLISVALHPHGVRPVRLVCCYLPHAKSLVLGDSPVACRRAVQEFFTTLHVICAGAARADLIISGDFNARTGLLAEIDRPGVVAWQGEDTVPDTLAVSGSHAYSACA